MCDLFSLQDLKYFWLSLVQSAIGYHFFSIHTQVSCMVMCMTRRRDLKDKLFSPNYWPSMLLTSHGYVILHTVEPPNKGHFGDNINSAFVSFVERLSSSRRFKMY